MNWKECGRRWPEPNMRHYHGIHLVELRKTTFCGQDIQCPGRDLNPNLPTIKQARILIGLKWHRIRLSDDTFVTAATKSFGIIATVLYKYRLVRECPVQTVQQQGLPKI
jgi:hypothetical protein